MIAMPRLSNLHCNSDLPFCSGAEAPHRPPVEGSTPCGIKIATVKGLTETSDLKLDFNNKLFCKNVKNFLQTFDTLARNVKVAQLHSSKRTAQKARLKSAVVRVKKCKTAQLHGCTGQNAG